MVKYRRIYDTKLKKMAIIGIPLVFVLFILLAQRGDITITGYDWTRQCAGTDDDKCIVWINFTANIDVYVYPMQEEWAFGLDKPVKEIRLYRSWGKGWRYVNLSKTWSRVTKYSIKFTNNTKYQIKIEVYKLSAFEDVKWAFTDQLDPVFKGINIEFDKLSNTDQCLVDCSLKFRFRINKSYNIDSLEKFKKKFVKFGNANNLVDSGFRLRQTVYYNVSTWIPNITCNPYNETTPNGTVEHSNCTDNGYYDIEEKSKYTWNTFNPLGKTIQADKWYYIELWGRKKARLGDNNVDAVPVFAGFEFPFALWFSGWDYRKNITFSGSTASEGVDLDDFPILVNLTSSNFDFNKAQDNGSDIRFTDIDSSTELDYEIESWDKANNNAEIWVKVPKIEADNLTDFIYMYYGNDTASDAQNAVGVWSNNYLAVIHLNGSSPTNLPDSLDVYNFTKKGSGEPANIDGKITGGQLFDDINDYASQATLMDLVPSALVISVWVKPTNAWSSAEGSHDYFADKQNDVAGNQVPFNMKFNAASGTITTYNTVGGDNTILSTTQNTWLAQFYHISAHFGTGGMKIYVDGTLSNSNAVTDMSDDGSNTDFFIGGNSAGAFGDVSMDELRVSNTTRGGNWTQNQWKSQNNTLITFGVEESLNTTPVVNLYNDTGLTEDTTPSIDFNYTDDDLKAKCYLLFNGTAYDVNTNTANATRTTLTANATLALDDYAVTVSCWDGERTGTSSSIILTIISVKPAITIISPTNTTYTTASIDLNWSANETLDWAGYELNGVANVSVYNFTFYDMQTAWSTGTGVGITSTQWIAFAINYSIDITLYDFSIGIYNYLYDPVGTTLFVHIINDTDDLVPNGTVIESFNPTALFGNHWIDIDNADINFAAGERYWIMVNSTQSYNFIYSSSTYPSETWLGDIRSSTTDAGSSWTTGYYSAGNEYYVISLGAGIKEQNTTIEAQQGSNTLYVWANDTFGNMNYSKVVFFVDSVAPIVTVENPKNNSGTTYDWMWVNITTDGTSRWCGYSLNESVNITLSNDSATHYYANLTNFARGTQNITFSCNDSLSNMNTSLMYFFDANSTPNISVSIITTPLEMNISSGDLSFNYTDQTVYWYNATPEGQNGNGTLNVTNDYLGYAADINVSLNETPTSCMTLYLSNSSTWDDKITLSTTNQTIYIGLAALANQMFWMWVDMINCSVSYTYPGEIIFDGWIP